ncbi:hypothetical protein EMPS_09751 [Entomortierella parvispora]|uniref:Uncharacterized protein n=1 Tax=Entomortierella parvispora TaxID=205924 RepID=A0A9P3M0N7_9FUNG|nr:hypothetical protein EMPS_09751 [Entomortierella parvispora]
MNEEYQQMHGGPTPMETDTDHAYPGVPVETALTFLDDATFIDTLNALPPIQPPNHELQNRVNALLWDGHTTPKTNETIKQTLHSLQRSYGLVLDEEPAPATALVVNVMNRKVQTNFILSSSAGDVVLPPCRLLLRRLARLVNTAIIVISSRSKTHVVRPEGDAADQEKLIVLLDLAESFRSLRTYVPLTCSITEPIPLPVQLMASSSIAKAEYMDYAREYTKHASVEFTAALAEHCFKQSCKATLKGRTKPIVAAALKKAEKATSEQDRENTMAKALEDFRKKERTCKKSPRHLVERAISILETSCKDPDEDEPPNITQEQFDEKVDKDKRLVLYHNFVEGHCHVLWKEVVDAKEENEGDDEPDDNGNGPTVPEGNEKNKPDIRVCQVPLQKILRNDFDFDTKGTICEILHEKQRLMSNHIDEIQVAILKAHIEIFRGRLFGTMTSVDISTILPDGFEIRDADLKKNPVIQLANVTEGILARLADTQKDDVFSTDLRNIFSQACLQYMAVRLDTTKHSKTGDHPVWDHVVSLINETSVMDDAVSCPTGMSQSRTELLRTMATNISNIWSGNIYSNLKRHVVRYLLRLHLRPLSEERYRALKKQKAEEKQQRQAVRQEKSRLRPKRHWQKLRSLLDQLDRAVTLCAKRWSGSTLVLSQSVSMDSNEDDDDMGESHDDGFWDDGFWDDGFWDDGFWDDGFWDDGFWDDDSDDDTRVLQPRTQRIQKVLHLIHRQIEFLASPLPTSPQLGLFQDTDSEDSEEENDEDDDEYDGFLQMLEEDHDPDLEKNHDSDGAAGDDSYKTEPKSKYLRGLEAVTCYLVDTNDPPNEITTADLRRHLFKGKSYKDNEVQMAVFVANALRPFAPRKNSGGHIPHHILATGPFVYLSNQLLFAMGYGDFARRISPVSSVGKMHPIPLNATGMYETLCSREEYHFDVRALNNKVIPDRKAANHSPAIMFGAFFKMDVVHKTCLEHGMIFANRFDFVDPSTVKIIGHSIRRYAPLNQIEVKKGRQKNNEKGQHQPSEAQLRQLDLVKSGLSKDRASELSAKLAEDIDVYDKFIKQQNRELA